MGLLNRERVNDLLIGAFEGGSNYWYNLPDIDNVLNCTQDVIDLLFVDRVIIAVYDHGVSLVVTDIENDELLGEFNLETIERGEKIMSEKYSKHFCDAYDETDDADTADVWFQCCVMGKVIYG